MLAFGWSQNLKSIKSLHVLENCSCQPLVIHISGVRIHLLHGPHHLGRGAAVTPAQGRMCQGREQRLTLLA